MAFAGRTLAWLNLAYRFGRHVVVQMPRRALRRGDDLQRFRDAVEPEGYVPLSPLDRARLPATMRCIDCGLCALACPTLRQAGGSAWDEAWTFVAGPSRSIDRARIVALQVTPCAGCDVCTAVCPTGVPITHLAGLIHRLAEPQPIES